MNNAKEILEKAYRLAQEGNCNEVPSQTQQDIDCLINNIENSKSLVSALITSLLKKILEPNQDIRLHRADFENGYSARMLDTKITTPFLKEKFPRYANKETAFLTLAIREKIAWTKKDGKNLKIRNKELKEAFLNIFEQIEIHQANPWTYLCYIFTKLISLSNNELQSFTLIPHNELKKERNINIYLIVNILKDLFKEKQSSRLPVIAVYSIYEILMPKLERFKDKKLLPLQVHTSSDKHTLGDIEIYSSQNTPFEIVEVKHNIPIDKYMVLDLLKKIGKTPINRYYLLTTFESTFQDKQSEQEIVKYIADIYQKTGVDIIVNGIISSLKYYLRFVDHYDEFIRTFTENLFYDAQNSTDVKKFHLKKWQEILQKYRIAESD